jgi:acyl-CoA reductase-like NAD-dependent aldehyde dehydrogenase
MADHLEHTQLLIGGELVDGDDAPFGVENPATETDFTTVPAASVKQVDAAIAAARDAFDRGPWPGLPVARRVAALSRMAEALAARRDELVETAIVETGSPLVIAQWAQVGMALDQARQLPELFGTLPQWEHNELPLDDYLGLDGRDVALSIRRYEACGVVAAITPYNFPLQTNVWKVFSALAAGCSVVLRPSPLTPLTALALAHAALEAELPPGLLNVVVEQGADGAQMLTSDPRVDCVSFTGIHVGRPADRGAGGADGQAGAARARRQVRAALPARCPRCAGAGRVHGVRLTGRSGLRVADAGARAARAARRCGRAAGGGRGCTPGRRPP